MGVANRYFSRVVEKKFLRHDLAVVVLENLAN
jgi:hypothetical protein